MGSLKGGFESCYLSHFVSHRDKLQDRPVITKKDAKALEHHHWDHSRSWSQNFTTEQANKFNAKRDDVRLTQNKFFGYQNTLNQIANHY